MDISIEQLKRMYLNDQLSCAEIGRRLGRDTKTIWTWLRNAGVQTRTTGNDPASRKGWKNLDVSHEVGRNLTDETKAKIRESRLRDGHVPYLKDGQHWIHFYGKERHPRWKGGITPERQALYASDEWQRVAREIWKRDRRTCQRCGKKHRKGEPFDIHHVVGFECRELRTTPSNLILLCEPCHYWVHGPENTEKEFIKPCP